MVTLEELSDSACGLQKMKSPGTKRVVAYTYPTCLLKLPHQIFVCIVIEVIYNQICRNPTLSSIRHFLERNVGDHLVIHVVCCNRYKVLSPIDFVPEQVPVVIIILVYSLFLLHSKSYIKFLIIIKFNGSELLEQKFLSERPIFPAQRNVSFL